MKKLIRGGLWPAVLMTALLVLMPLLGLAEAGTLLFSLQTPYRDDDRLFEFEVQLNEELDGSFGDLCFIGGRSAFMLSQGQSITATGIPEGTVFTLYAVKSTGYVPRYCNLVYCIQPEGPNPRRRDQWIHHCGNLYG